MKKAVIILSGIINNISELAKLNIEEFDVYCADGGANYAREAKLVPKMILGDLDSISNETLEFYTGKTEFKKFPKEKDFTDGELIIEEIYNLYDKIYVFGALGGLHHHLLGNIMLLEKYRKIELIDLNEKIFFLEKSHEFTNKENFLVSFIPLDSENILTLKGFMYPLNSKLIKRGESITLSNIINEKSAVASIEKGSFLCIIERKKEDSLI